MSPTHRETLAIIHHGEAKGMTVISSKSNVIDYIYVNKRAVPGEKIVSSFGSSEYCTTGKCGKIIFLGNNDSNDEALSVPDNNTIDNNSDVQKETDEDLLLGNGDEHPNAADEHIDSDIDMKLLKGDQADYEGGDEGINGSKECAQRRKVLKLPTIRNKACQTKPDSTADGNYRLPAFSVLAQSILNG